MKMQGLYLEQQMNNVLNVACNLLTQRQKKFAFIFFQLNQPKSDFDSLCLVLNSLLGLMAFSRWNLGHTWVLWASERWWSLTTITEYGSCLGREHLYCYQDLFFSGVLFLRMLLPAPTLIPLSTCLQMFLIFPKENPPSHLDISRGPFHNLLNDFILFQELGSSDSFRFPHQKNPWVKKIM